MHRLVAVSLTLCLAAPTVAQQRAGDRELVDRVVAVVGDTVLLLSDVNAELQQMQAAGRQIPEDERARNALLEEVLQSRVNDLVLVTAAKAAGIQVRDEEITEIVDQEMRTAQERFRTEAEFHSALAASGFTLEQYRQMIGQQYRARMLAQRYLQQRLAQAPRPPVTEAEIRQFFDAQRDQLEARPAAVSFQQVLIEVTPSPEGRQAARDRGMQVLEELRAGANFEVLARRYSDDPGSREQGGDLGWFRRGRMVPAFENVVFAMRPGQTSGLVETDYGFHIIRLERVRGTERQARHILIRPELNDDDLQRAWERADSVAAAARAGTPFSELIRRYPTPGENRVERVPLDRLPPLYQQLLADSRAGDVVGPFEERGATGPVWIVARVSERMDAGAWSLDDVREQIRERLEEQKLIEQLLADLHRTTYVNVML